jgi:hypothetical protein
MRMTAERFEALTAAFGADPSHWPPAERDAAWAFATQHDEASAIVQRAAALDRALDAPPRPDPSPPLLARVIAAAPLARSARRAWRWLTGAGIGVGLAAACAAGVAVGALYSPAVTSAFSSAGQSSDDAVAEVAGLTDDPG